MRAWRLARSPGGQVIGGLVLAGAALFGAVYVGAAVVLAVEAVHGLSAAAVSIVFSALVGTALLGAWATAIAAPLGAGLALWARWLAPPAFRGPATTLIALVGEIPPACLLVPLLLVPTSGGLSVWSLLIVGVALTAVPTVAGRALNALDRVPADEVLQAIALGARPAEAVAAVVVPRAAADLFRAVLSGLSRVIGETVIVVVVLDGVVGGPQVLPRAVVLGLLDPSSVTGGVGPAAALALAVLGAVSWTAGVLAERAP